jgi:hypothetical protein
VIVDGKRKENPKIELGHKNENKERFMFLEGKDCGFSFFFGREDCGFFSEIETKSLC